MSSMVPSLDGPRNATTSNNNTNDQGFVPSASTGEERHNEAVRDPFPTKIPRPLFVHGKKGVCLTLRESGRKGSYTENLPKLVALNPDWSYSWAPRPAEEVPLDVSEAYGPRIIRSPNTTREQPEFIEYAPMLWGYYPQQFEARLEEIQQQQPKVDLGFNEPDSPMQSNIPVDTAVQAWSDLVTSLSDHAMHPTNDLEPKDAVFLVSPSCVDPLGSWCRSFWEQTKANDLRVDAIGVHYYGGPNAPAFRQQLLAIYNVYDKKPLLVTEFAVADWQASSVDTNRYSPEQVLAFLEEVLPWMEDQDWILGYSWYSFDIHGPRGTSSALFDKTIDGDDDGTNQAPKLTPLGEFYARFRSGTTLGTKRFHTGMARNHLRLGVSGEHRSSPTPAPWFRS